MVDKNPRGLNREGQQVRPGTDLFNLLEAAEQVAQIGSWEWLPQADVLQWSDNLYRLCGLEPGELVPNLVYVFQQTHPDDRDRVMRYVESILWTSNPPSIEYRILHPTLGVRHLRSSVVTVEAGGRGATRIVGAVQDVSDEQLTVREIAAHLAVSKALSEWGRHEDGIVHLLCELGRALGFVSAAMWLPRDRVLLPREVWSEPALDLGDHEAATLALRLPLGVGLPGRSWRSKEPETLSDIDEDESHRRRRTAQQAGLRGAVTLPAVHAGEVVAVLEFHHREEAPPSDRIKRTLVAIGYELGGFLSRRGGQLDSEPLTPRQLDVLRLAAAGNTTAQIALELRLSASTVRTHFDHVYEKLGVSARTAAVAQGLRLGLIE